MGSVALCRVESGSSRDGGAAARVEMVERSGALWASRAGCVFGYGDLAAVLVGNELAGVPECWSERIGCGKAASMHTHGAAAGNRRVHQEPGTEYAAAAGASERRSSSQAGQG